MRYGAVASERLAKWGLLSQRGDNTVENKGDAGRGRVCT